MHGSQLLASRIPLLTVVLSLAAFGLVVGGCGDSGGTGPAKLVPLTIQAGGTGAQAAGARVRGISPAGVLIAENGDTIPVTFTSAWLVTRDVRFKLSDDGSMDTTGGEWDSTGTGETDSTGTGECDSTGVGEDDDHESAGMIIFRGPFAIDLLTQQSQTLDTEMVPPGVYRRVQGHLAALRAGQNVGDGMGFLIGSTVYMQGTVDGEGGGPFTYAARIDNEFMIRGTFTVETDTPATAFIVFDVSNWLTGRDGQFLDPRIPENDKWIKWAIRHSIKVGMDDDHDGNMDDAMHEVED
jgi:hypothetical protein